MPPAVSAGGPPAVASARSRLAQLALDSALGFEQVSRGVRGPGGAWTTSYADRPLDGVVAAAAAGGRYSIELHLSVAWPPGSLPQLGDRLRAAITEGARNEGLESALGAIHIAFEDIDPPPFATPQKEGPG